MRKTIEFPCGASINVDRGNLSSSIIEAVLTTPFGVSTIVIPKGVEERINGSGERVLTQVELRLNRASVPILIAALQDFQTP